VRGRGALRARNRPRCVGSVGERALLEARHLAFTAPRIVSGPTLLTGICFCAACGMAMTLHTGKSGQLRYYICLTKARQGETDCKGPTVPMDKLDTLVADHIERRLLQPVRRWLKCKNGGF
jgi:site-specific DNA recombinase